MLKQVLKLFSHYIKLNIKANVYHLHAGYTELILSGVVKNAPWEM